MESLFERIKMKSLFEWIFYSSTGSFEEFSRKIYSIDINENILKKFIDKLQEGAKDFEGKYENVCWFYRWLLTNVGYHFINDSSIEAVRRLMEGVNVSVDVMKKIKWAVMFGGYAFLNSQHRKQVSEQILQRFSVEKTGDSISSVTDTWMVYHILFRWTGFQTLGLYEETLIINYISLVDSHPELEAIFGTAIERDLEFLYKRVSPPKKNESKKKPTLKALFNFFNELSKKAKEKAIKPKRFIIEKIETILKKRYAIEKIVERKKFLTLLFPSILSFVLFFGFLIFISLHKEKGDINEFWTSLGYFFLMLFLLLFAYRIWKAIGEFIPKFMLVGFLGWFLIGSAVVTGILVPGSLTDNNEYSIQIPMSRFTGVNEDEVESTVEFHPETQDFDLRQIFDIFLSPSLFKLERSNQDSLINQKDKNKKKLQEKNDIPPLFVNRLFYFIRLTCFFLLIILLMCLYCIVTKSKKDGVDEKKKEARVKCILFSVGILMAVLFFLTHNYFFILVLLLIIFNLFIIRWEILQRGQNHQIYSRSVLFLFLTQVFAMISGEIFFLVFLPVYIFISPLNHILSLFDAILINWIVLVGSQASVLIGLVTQVVWSGKRLTEKL